MIAPRQKRDATSHTIGSAATGLPTPKRIPWPAGATVATTTLPGFGAALPNNHNSHGNLRIGETRSQTTDRSPRMPPGSKSAGIAGGTAFASADATPHPAGGGGAALILGFPTPWTCHDINEYTQMNLSGAFLAEHSKAAESQQAAKVAKHVRHTAPDSIFGNFCCVLPPGFFKQEEMGSGVAFQFHVKTCAGTRSRPRLNRPGKLVSRRSNCFELRPGEFLGPAIGHRSLLPVETRRQLVLFLPGRNRLGPSLGQQFAQNCQFSFVI